MTTHLVTNTAELHAAFNAAADGDRIELAGGNYGAVKLLDRDFAQGITLAQADPGNPAVMTHSLYIKGCSGITIDGIDLDAAGLAKSFSWTRAQIRDSSDITLRDMLIDGYIPTAADGAVDPTSVEAIRSGMLDGYAYENGLMLRGTDGVTLENVEISNLRVGLRLNTTSNTTVTGLDLHDCREGVNFNEASDLLIQNSIFQNLKPWYDPDGHKGDHGDMIQFWGVNSTTGVHGITIQDNVFIQPVGTHAQTIFGHLTKAPEGVTASDFTITGNTIISGSANAIKLSHVTDAVIADNILLPNSEALTYNNYARISLKNVDNVQVDGNTLLPRHNGDVLNLDATQMANQNVTVTNTTFLSDVPTDPNYWKLVHDAILAGPVDPAPGVVLSPAPVAPVITAEEIAGTDAAETLTDRRTAPDEESYFRGFGGNDKIIDTGGNDWLEGGEGADQFIFDTRKSGSDTSHDVVLDLNFAEGDSLRFLTGMDGLFSDDVDPTHKMRVSSDGASVIVRGVDDLVELQAGNALRIDAQDDGSGVMITLYDEVARTIELDSIQMSDLGLG